MPDIYSEVGVNIRSQRLQQGLTLEDLAELSDLHASYVGQIERGVKKCSLKTVAALAKALGVRVPMLMTSGAAALEKASVARQLEAAVRANSAEEKKLLLLIVKHLAKGLREVRS